MTNTKATNNTTIGDVVGGRQMTYDECIQIGELMKEMREALKKGDTKLAKKLSTEINRRIEIYQQRTPW